MIIFLLLILLFITLEKIFFHSLERFIDTDYDYFYNGDVLIDTRKNKIGVGVGNISDSRYAINVGGTLFVRDKLCYGNTCLDAKMLKLLSNVPHFKPDKLCLRTPDNDKVCITEDHLQLLTGQRALRLKSGITDNRTNVEKPRYFRRHNFYAHPNHDDNDDYYPPHCGPGSVTYQGNTCSHSTGGKGNFRGYVANPVMDKFNGTKEDRGCFKLNRGIKWQEDFPNADKFAIQVNPDNSREKYFPDSVKRNFKSKPINYKCFNNT